MGRRNSSEVIDVYASVQVKRLQSWLVISLDIDRSIANPVTITSCNRSRSGDVGAISEPNRLLAGFELELPSPRPVAKAIDPRYLLISGGKEKNIYTLPKSIVLK